MPVMLPKLTEDEVVRFISEHVEGLFPKTCNKCQKIYPTYREYLLQTKRIGIPLSYDIELGNWKPTRSTGNLALANCHCGSTLAISSSGMPLTRIWQILRFFRKV